VTPIPLATLPDDIAGQVDQLGAKQVNLYRCLAHAPDLLRAWIAFAWALRGNSSTSRQLRELMILRTATLHHSPTSGTSTVAWPPRPGSPTMRLPNWRCGVRRRAFSPETRAALAFTDAIVEGNVPDEINDEPAAHFNLTQRIG